MIQFSPNSSRVMKNVHTSELWVMNSTLAYHEGGSVPAPTVGAPR